MLLREKALLRGKCCDIKSVMKFVTLAEARKHAAEILEWAVQGPVEISGSSSPIATIVPFYAFATMFAGYGHEYRRLYLDLVAEILTRHPNPAGDRRAGIAYHCLWMQRQITDCWARGIAAGLMRAYIEKGGCDPLQLRPVFELLLDSQPAKPPPELASIDAVDAFHALRNGKAFAADGPCAITVAGAALSVAFDDADTLSLTDDDDDDPLALAIWSIAAKTGDAVAQTQGSGVNGAGFYAALALTLDTAQAGKPLALVSRRLDEIAAAPGGYDAYLAGRVA